jgi:hypothetical protein
MVVHNRTLWQYLHRENKKDSMRKVLVLLYLPTSIQVSPMALYKILVPVRVSQGYLFTYITTCRYAPCVLFRLSQSTPFRIFPVDFPSAPYFRNFRNIIDLRLTSYFRNITANNHSLTCALHEVYYCAKTCCSWIPPL